MIIAQTSTFDLLAFLGRLHPIMVHLPIGLLTGAVLLELLSLRAKEQESVSSRRVLHVCTAAAGVMAALAGWFLGDEGGQNEETLFWHRWTGVALAVLLLLPAWLSFTNRWRSAAMRFIILAPACLLMTYVGHLGGTMTHGASFLTQYGPSWLNTLLIPEDDAAPIVDIEGLDGDALTVYTMFQASCVECHGPTRQKANLRLDETDGIASVLVEGDPAASELFRRIALAPGHDDIMPPDDEPMTEASIQATYRWIRDGAQMLALEASIESDVQAAAESGQALAQVVNESRAHIVVLPESGRYEVNFAARTGPVSDDQVRALQSVAESIEHLSLAGRTFSANAFAELNITDLESLHLERTDVDDDALRTFLASAPNITSLNLHSTKITDASANAIAALPRLTKLVVSNTAMSTEAMKQLERDRPQLAVTGDAALKTAFADGGPRLILAADASKRRIALMQEIALGRPITLWEDDIENIHDLHVLPNGNILYQKSWTRIIERNPTTNEVVWSYDAAQTNRAFQGERVEVHAFERHPDGRTMIAESGPARIIEVDTDGTITSVTPLSVDRPDAHHDTRLVRTTPDGTYLVAHEFDGMVREYNRSGEVIWSYDVPSSWTDPNTGAEHSGDGDHVFAAVRRSNGNTLIGAGNGHGVLEVTPDGRIVWSIAGDELDGIQLAWVTTVQERPNGNIVIGNCHAGEGQPQIIEVTRAKEVVWKFHDFRRFGNALSNSLVLDDDAHE